MRSTAVWAAILGPAGVSAVLNTLAQQAGLKYFGSCLSEGELNVDASYTSIISDTTEFGGLTPENGMKWDATEATQGVFTYAQGDITANQAKKTGQVLRCHTQIWYSQLPSWVSSGSWTQATLQAVMESHMTNVMGHYKGDCYAWDVVNEAIADDGTWRSDVWLNTFNTSYVPLAFNIAKQADPNVKLYYNDYNLEYNGAKTDTAVRLVQLVQAAGAPIDGVGFQGHMIVGSTPGRSSLATALKRFTALGLEVAYTELDIRHSSLPPSSSALVQQGDDYASMVGSCLDVTGCVGVTLWGVTDKYSWVPQTFSGEGDALLYDDNYNRKIAWTSVSSVLAAKATSPPASSTPAPSSTTTSTTLATVTTTPVSVKPSTTSSTTAAHSTTSSAVGAQQTHWGQCGGNGWSGPTSCQSPYTCQKQNDWYSQCL